MIKKKCEWCGKKIEGNKQKRYCNLYCRNPHYYQKNKKKISIYRKEYILKKCKNLCRCGNEKYIRSKQCLKCHTSNKHKFQLSRV